MGTRIFWYIKEHDGRYPWHPDGRYAVDHGRLIRIAQTLDQRGFYGVLQGTGTGDPTVTLSSLIGFTKRLRFLLPVYPGLRSPRLLAAEAQVFDKLSNGRLLINIVNGQDPQLAPYGLFIPHDERYEFSRQYWRLFVEFYEGRGVDYAGTYLDPRPAFEPGSLEAPPIWRDPIYRIPYESVQRPHPPLYGAGASPAGQDHAGEIVENYLAFLREFDLVKAQIEEAHAAAARHGREFQHVGVHGSVIVRRTRQQALDAFYEGFELLGAERFADLVDRRIKQITQGRFDLTTFAAPDAKRQSWVDALRAGRLPTIEELEIEPGLYAGNVEFAQPFDVFKSNGGAIYFVGSGEDVAAKIRQYEEIPGVDSFIFSGWPLAQEAEYFADYVFPHLDDLES